MIQGLTNLGDAGLLEIGRMIGIQGKFTPQQIVESTLKWMGKAVDCKDPSPSAVERAALEWVARHWSLKTDTSVSTDDLERSIRVKVASDAADFMAPTWAVVCSLIAVGPKDAIAPKLVLLEKAASLIVPSMSARAKLMDGWRLDAEKVVTAEELKPCLDKIKGQSSRIDQTLNLAIVIALADGRMALEEELLLKAIAEEWGKSGNEVVDMVRKINAEFWGHQVQVTPKNVASTPKVEQEAALKAAELTLGSSGALEGLAFEAGEKMSAEVEGAPKAGWQRMLGGLSGLHNYFSSKMRSADQVTLVRIVYLSILRQHAMAVQEHQAAQAVTAVTVHEAVRPRSTHEVGPSTVRHAIKLPDDL